MSNKKTPFLLIGVIALILVVFCPQLTYGEDSSGFSFGASANPTVNSTNSSSSCNTPDNITELFDYGICVLSGGVIRFIIGLGVVMFLIGVLQYVMSGDNEEKREGGRNLMIFGIIALFVMISVWGFVKILTTSFGFDFALPTNLPPSGQ